MKITLVIPSLEVGGVERVMLRLAEGLLKKGVSVDLVVANAYGSMLRSIPDGVRVEDLKVSRVLQSIPKLVKYIRRVRPDAIISAKDYQNIVILWAVKLANITTKVIVTTHIDVAADWKQSRGFKSRLIPYLVKYCYPWADHIVTVSNGARDSLARTTRLPLESIKTIYNPVVSKSIFEMADEPMESRCVMDGAFPVVLGVGRLTRQKDFETLIRAFALVYLARPAHLVILGEGEERARLEALVRELKLERNVHMPGFVDNPYKYMKRATVTVVSSRWEGFPTVPIEALALGTPVVSTDCPSGPSEILEDGRWGPLVPVGDYESLSKEILRVIDHPPNKEKLMERGREFSIERAVDAYLRLIEYEE